MRGCGVKDPHDPRAIPSTRAYTGAMTVLDIPLPGQRTPGPIRNLGPTACALPASWLRNPVVAQWFHGSGWAVVVCDDDELDLTRACGVDPGDVVMRCAETSATIRRGATSGVVRYIASTERHIDVLADCVAPAKHVYLDERGPIVLGERRLDVVGMHRDIGISPDPAEWAAAAKGLLTRAASLRGCGLAMRGISLAGGSAQMWRSGGGPELRAVREAVEIALDGECARWRLRRPTVVLAPSAG